MKTSLWSNFTTNMFCQPYALERATNTDDVTYRTLGWQTDIRSENSKSVGFTQNNVWFIVQLVTSEIMSLFICSLPEVCSL